MLFMTTQARAIHNRGVEHVSWSSLAGYANQTPLVLGQINIYLKKLVSFRLWLKSTMKHRSASTFLLVKRGETCFSLGHRILFRIHFDALWSLISLAPWFFALFRIVDQISLSWQLCALWNFLHQARWAPWRPPIVLDTNNLWPKRSQGDPYPS